MGPLPTADVPPSIEQATGSGEAHVTITPQQPSTSQGEQPFSETEQEEREIAEALAKALEPISGDPMAGYDVDVAAEASAAALYLGLLGDSQ
jgi:hypothetical protein